MPTQKPIQLPKRRYSNVITEWAITQQGEPLDIYQALQI